MEGQTHNKIDAAKITPPQVKWTPMALTQLELINEHDITLRGKYFRVLISGKGCDGFTYSTGFTDKKNDDLEIDIEDSRLECSVIMDPFAAFYLQDLTIDYLQTHDSEGFVIKNHLQEKYSGKFWKSNKDLVPPMITS